MVSLCLGTFLNQLFSLSLTRCEALSKTGGLHRETPSTRYCVFFGLEVICNGAHKLRAGNPPLFNKYHNLPCPPHKMFKRYSPFL